MVYNGTDIDVMQSTFNQNNATNGGAIYFEVVLFQLLLLPRLLLGQAVRHSRRQLQRSMSRLEYQMSALPFWNGKMNRSD